MGGLVFGGFFFFFSVLWSTQIWGVDTCGDYTENRSVGSSAFSSGVHTCAVCLQEEF